MNHTDIAIAGAGVLGLVLAIAAEKAGKRTLVFGPPPEEEKMGRMIALSYDSVGFLNELGVFSRIRDAMPIRGVTVVDANHKVFFHAHDLQLPALGYTCSYLELYAACRASTNTPIADHLPEKTLESRNYLAILNNDTVTAKVLALTTPASLPAENYQRLRQSTLITAFAESEPFEHAFEIFTDKGPVALLPCPNGIFMVASLQEEDAVLLEGASSTGQQKFLQALIAPAQVTLQRPRVLQKLSLTARYCKKKPGARTLVLGDAWHTLHPIGAQGLNLGLRDVRALQNILTQFDDPGHQAAVKTFYHCREDDVLFTLGLTETLAFLSTGPFLARFAKRQVIDALSSIGILRRLFFEHAVYGWSKV